MTDKVLAATLIAPKRIEVREYDMPAPGPDAGLLRIERCGVCGSDVSGWQSMRRGVRVLGHENLGTIAQIGREAQERWGVKEGDRVALEEYIPCGVCAVCRSGDYRFCPQTDIGLAGDRLWYGSTSAAIEPAIWGGFSQYLYMHPGTVVHRMPEHVPPSEAAFFLPLSNGFEWVSGYGGAPSGRRRRRPGSRPAGPCVRRRGQGGRRLPRHRQRVAPGRGPACRRQRSRRGRDGGRRERVARRARVRDHRRARRGP